ncbi:MAG: hypothetical protein HAW60_02070 [Bdellovibrionales bacterium]|nr:hypothetical protein [Bdellovibrionales bacterium]
MNILKKYLLSLFAIVLFSFNSNAADLYRKMGLGYQNTEIPALSTRYHFQQKLSLTVSTGFTTNQNHTKFLLEGKIQKVLFEERYLNVFVGTGIGIINERVKSGNLKNNGFKIHATMGAEFFLVNLPNLGFIFETGVSLQSKSGNIQVDTLAYVPFNAGVYFYF